MLHAARMSSLAVLLLVAAESALAGTVTSWAEVSFNHYGYVPGASTVDTGTIVYADVENYGWSDILPQRNYGRAGAWGEGTGVLHALASGSASGTVLKTSADAQANFTTSVLFSGPGTDPIRVSLNLLASGSVSTSGPGSSYADAEFYGYVGNFSFDYRNCSFNGSSLACGSAMSLTGTTVTNSFWVTPNTPIDIALRLHVGYQGMSIASSWASGNVDFSHTAGFATSGPVFNLPEGYTVNSDDGAIVNNQSGGAPNGVDTPEPSQFAALGLALALLPILKRRGSPAA